MADPRIKQLRIKTGVLKRTCKEKISYEKEAEQIQEKIKKMQEEGQDVYYIKKQDQLLQETQAVILDCQKRLNAAYQDLKAFVEAETELEEVEEYQAAKTAVEESESHITA
ncbi:tubulin-specific chaperone A-like [Macrobrachium nipponense]|uniref:tubulin-specific chaperone A-like n=1 Tax=Macrobrachium nipponense TaxID=159736 RepID=UPI0030C85C87